MKDKATVGILVVAILGLLLFLWNVHQRVGVLEALMDGVGP